MKPADRAWCALAAGVVIYDVCARDGETLSDGACRYPLVPRGLVIAVLGAHLLEIIPSRYDPLHLLLIAAKAKRIKGE